MYTLNKDDILGFANFISAQTKQVGNELMFKWCPLCNGSGRDKETFSINLDNGAFNCLRASCGYKGHFVELCRDFGYELDDKKPTIYRPIEQPKGKVQTTDRAVEYMESRGISREITERYEITSRKDNPDVICFPFRDEKNVLQFIKFRNSRFVKGKTQGSKEWTQKDAMPILYGMNLATDRTKPLVITEGQIDALSVAQAGIPNAVSVPTGAKGFTFFPICHEWIESFPEVIIFGDNENGKITLVDEFKARLTIPMRVVQRSYYLGEKDANDILRKYGVKAIQLAVEKAETPRINNILQMSDVAEIDINELEKIETGFDELDKHLGGGICLGQVCLITGNRGEGKTTFVSQIAAEALEQNRSILMYSGELAAFHLRRWLDLQLAGINHIQTTINKFGEEQYSISHDVENRISEWYRNRAYVYDNDYIPLDGTEFESIPDTIVKAIKTYNVSLICVDNLMTAMANVGDPNALHIAQSQFVGQLKLIAQKYQVVILLVAHPRKTQDTLGNNDVSGSSDITNKVDIVLSYGRDPKSDCNGGMVQILKNRLFGKLRIGEDAIKTLYSPQTRRVIEFAKRNTRPKVYSWENSYAIKELPKDEPIFDTPTTETTIVEDDDDLPF